MIHDTEFLRLAKEDPEELIRLIESGPLANTELTFAAEYLGEVVDDWRVEQILLGLLQHKSVIVVEGAIYGLVTWAEREDRKESVRYHLGLLRERTKSPGLLTAIADVLEEWS